MVAISIYELAACVFVKLFPRFQINTNALHTT